MAGTPAKSSAAERAAEHASECLDVRLARAVSSACCTVRQSEIETETETEIETHSEVTHVRQADEKPRQEETTKHSLACFAARSAALDLAGVPAKIEHRGQKKKLK